MLAELDSTQFIAAQPIHASTKRGDWQVIVVDAESGRKTWQIDEEESGVDGNLQIGQTERQSKENC